MRLPTLLLLCFYAVQVVWLAGCATLPAGTEPPWLSIISIEPVQVTPLEQKYQFRVRIQNPNDHDLDITGMNYVLAVNGRDFLKGVSNEAITVPRYGESTIELTGVSTLFGFVRQLQALQEQQTQNLHYRLSGNLSLSGGFGRLPFSYEGSLLPPAASKGGV